MRLPSIILALMAMYLFPLGVPFLLTFPRMTSRTYVSLSFLKKSHFDLRVASQRDVAFILGLPGVLVRKGFGRYSQGE
jgi:hypothetical protein